MTMASRLDHVFSQCWNSGPCHLARSLCIFCTPARSNVSYCKNVCTVYSSQTLQVLLRYPPCRVLRDLQSLYHIYNKSSSSVGSIRSLLFFVSSNRSIVAAVSATSNITSCGLLTLGNSNLVILVDKRCLYLGANTSRIFHFSCVRQ